MPNPSYITSVVDDGTLQQGDAAGRHDRLRDSFPFHVARDAVALHRCVEVTSACCIPCR